MQELIADVLRDLSAPLPSGLRDASFRFWLLNREPGAPLTFTEVRAFTRWGRMKAEHAIAAAVADGLLSPCERGPRTNALAWVVSAEQQTTSKPNPHQGSLLDGEQQTTSKLPGSNGAANGSASRRVKTGKGRPIVLSVVKPGNSELWFLRAWDAHPSRVTDLEGRVKEVEKGDRLRAEKRWQAMVDAGIPPAIIAFSLKAYLTESKKVREGYVMALSTFMGDPKGFPSWRERGLALYNAELEKKGQAPLPARVIQTPLIEV